jgi:hypothetical protein
LTTVEFFDPIIIIIIIGKTTLFEPQPSVEDPAKSASELDPPYWF